MRFELVDRVVELAENRIVTVKAVTMAEEYLADHFPTFPVLPGVFMLEALAQSARKLLVHAHGPACSRHVLGAVKALKYGTFLAPGDTMTAEIQLLTLSNDNHPATATAAFKAKATASRSHAADQASDDPQTPPQAPQVCVSGRFELRPLNLASPPLTPNPGKHAPAVR